LGKATLAAVALAATIFVGALSYLYVYEWSSPRAPRRAVGDLAIVVGKVESITREAYAVEIALKILSEEKRSPRFQVGDVIAITFSGIGAVSSWRSWSLKEGDVIRCQIRWVEGAYWEAYDTDWEYVGTG